MHGQVSPVVLPVQEVVPSASKSSTAMAVYGVSSWTVEYTNEHVACCPWPIENSAPLSTWIMSGSPLSGVSMSLSERKS
jgi:hypothetical protein